MNSPQNTDHTSLFHVINMHFSPFLQTFWYSLPHLHVPPEVYILRSRRKSEWRSTVKKDPNTHKIYIILHLKSWISTENDVYISTSFKQGPRLKQGIEVTQKYLKHLESYTPPNPRSLTQKQNLLHLYKMNFKSRFKKKKKFLQSYKIQAEEG